jgi:glucose-1-phosphate thymidylyltransferase
MDIVLLCGGYGTRMGELTANTPKQLLDVAGKPVLERVMDSLGELVYEGRNILVTNAKFAEQFEAWAKDYRARHPDVQLQVYNDGTTRNEERLGAVGNMRFAIDKAGIKDDVLILGTDNMFSRPLEPLIRGAQAEGKPFNALYDVKDKAIARELGIVAVSERGVIRDFLEKPQEPPSTLASCAVYYLPASYVPQVAQYLDEGNKPDKSGDFVDWLRRRTDVAARPVDGTWFDMGHKTTLEQARTFYSQSEQPIRGQNGTGGGAREVISEMRLAPTTVSREGDSQVGLRIPGTPVKERL